MFREVRVAPVQHRGVPEHRIGLMLPEAHGPHVLHTAFASACYSGGVVGVTKVARPPASISPRKKEELRCRPTETKRWLAPSTPWLWASRATPSRGLS